MNKELEAFRDILGILSAVSGCEVDMNSERVKIIKKALTEYEKIKAIMDTWNTSGTMPDSEALRQIDEVLNNE